MQSHEFFEVLPDGRYRFRVDHHLLEDFNRCDRLFQFRHMPDPEGLVWATKSLPIKVVLGSWWSAAMENYYNIMRTGRMPTEADVVHIVEMTWTVACLDHYQSSDPEHYEKFGGLEGARVMAMDYHRTFGEAHFRNWEIIASELGFGLRNEIKLGEDLDVQVYYTGRPDLVVYDRAQEMVMPVDFKTKDFVPYNAQAIVKPLPQLCGYIYATRKLMKSLQKNGSGPKLPTKCCVLFCARLKPSEKPRDGVKKPRFLPVYAYYSLEELEEWRLNTIDKCHRMKTAIEQGVFPPRESACHLYSGCQFRRVCSMPANVRQTILLADFVKQQPWQPYEIQEND